MKPSFDDHIQPTSRYADILVPGQSNDRSIDLITGHIRRQLEERKSRLRGELFEDAGGSSSKEETKVEAKKKEKKGELPDSVQLLRDGSQLRVRAPRSIASRLF